MILRRYIATVCLLFLAVQSFGTHIVGGEIFYDCLGGNRYYITLKLYLDCCPSCTPHDDVAAIGVFDAQGNAWQNPSFPLLKIEKVPPTLYSECFFVPSDICVNEIVYGDTLDLPPIAGGYKISYQRCCRNADILNVTDAHNVGSTYETFIDPSLPQCNNSTRYKGVPPLLLCVDVPFIFDNSAIDPDGDSIYYEFCNPYTGADATAPMPSIPSVPPYQYVSYNIPYSSSYPIASSPAFKINPKTGIITGTPNMIGRFVVGVCANEYRNGVLLNVNKRDYQFNVTNCPKAAKAIIPDQSLFCQGLTVNFSQNSINAKTYYWDFGDGTTTADTSTLVSPSWTYPAVGTYTIMLIVNKDTKCADTAFSTVKVQELLSVYFIPPGPKCMNEFTEGFIAKGTYTNSAAFHWDFGYKASPVSSDKKDPGKIFFKEPGTYPVTIVVTQNGCIRKYTETIQILQKPEVSIPNQTLFCMGLTMNFSQNSSNASTYHWDFGDAATTADTSNLMSPSWTYSKTGTYPITLIVDKYKQCSDTAYSTIKVQNLLEPYFVPPNPKCMYELNDAFVMKGTYSNATTFHWDFGLKAIPAVSDKRDPGKILFKEGGMFPITLTVKEDGCIKKYTDSLRVWQKPEAKYETEVPLACELQPVHFLNKSTGPAPLTYLWAFGDELVSKEESPYHTYKKVGSYLTSLIIASPNGCKDTFELPASLVVNQTPTAGFDIDPKDTSVFYSQVHLSDFSKNTTNCNMFWGDGSVPGNCMTGHDYTVPGTYQVMQIVENNGCFDTTYARVIVRPEFVFWLPNAFTPGESDGLNDVYKPKLYGVHDYRFMVFDRWGEKLFDTSNPEEGWSGYRNNRLCQEDVYVYKITFRDDVSLKGHQYIGHFTLVK